MIQSCECPPLMIARIDVLVTRRWEQADTNVDAITLAVLETLYAYTVDGQPIDWRTLSIDTDPCLLELRRRVRVRVVYVLAHHDEDSAQRRWQKIGSTQ